MEGRHTFSFITGILGMLYLVYAGMMMYNWIVETFMRGIGTLGNVLGLFVPSDPGCAVALTTVGMLMLGSLHYKLDNARGIACVFLGSLLGTALLTIQLLVLLSDVASIGVSLLSGEIAEYIIIEDVLKPEVVLGIGSIILLPFFTHEISRIDR
ncbi:MAG: hypothetical protein ACTSVF_05285 [Candidatus Asgardarchaeia archaeon]